MRRSFLAALLSVVTLATMPAHARLFQSMTKQSPVIDCTVTDGDTIRCGAERIRLLGIDAPELAGHCRRGRACAPGDGPASRRSLAAAMTGHLTVERYGRDRYSRTLAIVHADGVNLSCRQLERRQAIYKARWDNGGRVASECPAMTNLHPSH